MVPILVLITFIGVILFFHIRESIRERAEQVALSEENGGVSIHAIPSGYRLSGNHVWIQELSSGSVRIGVDELLQRFVGAFDRVELKSSGSIISQGESLAVFHRAGKELHIRSPFSAQIIRTNGELIDSPNVIASDPYRMGWLYQLVALEPHSNSELIRKGYTAVRWLTDEFIRLRDFVQNRMPKPDPIGVTMGDGGELQSGLMDYLGQEEIAQFETEFLVDYKR